MCQLTENNQKIERTHLTSDPYRNSNQGLLILKIDVLTAQLSKLPCFYCRKYADLKISILELSTPKFCDSWVAGGWLNTPLGLLPILSHFFTFQSENKASKARILDLCQRKPCSAMRQGGILFFILEFIAPFFIIMRQVF